MLRQSLLLKGNKLDLNDTDAFSQNQVKKLQSPLTFILEEMIGYKSDIFPGFQCLQGLLTDESGYQIYQREVGLTLRYIVHYPSWGSLYSLQT